MAKSYRTVAFTPLARTVVRAHDGVMRTFLRHLRDLINDFAYGVDAGNAIRHGGTPRARHSRRA